MISFSQDFQLDRLRFVSIVELSSLISGICETGFLKRKKESLVWRKRINEILKGDKDYEKF